MRTCVRVRVCVHGASTGVVVVDVVVVGVVDEEVVAEARVVGCGRAATTTAHGCTTSSRRSLRRLDRLDVAAVAVVGEAEVEDGGGGVVEVAVAVAVAARG